MSYATQDDLIAWCGMGAISELTELTDPKNRTIDDDIIADKLDQADREIAARLVGVSLPLHPPYPQILVDVACRISRYFLYTQGRPDYVTDDFNLALKLLDDIRTGKATLGLTTDGTIAASAFGIHVLASKAAFTDELLA